ncbi:MAG: aminotransferase class I/II-fold pyridoxal phosphate-dependent enzyme [Gammaproteobacteria bacterium]|nr:PLP-dependent aminotransferase family protein [Gammaproteobacteria bacterium]NIP88485.1 PLP-dependent aminotransferase family protein [Gammaproteobacteria bacterium]NIR23206.1 PLP-dependent aminotransferase family protein [Gammaproteobacteria bacterium]NIS04777.1 PLP-dependent aminotransferase family protein [Gammaproteobacteria bacterium]NIU40055.1 aminotransferase class I/II-fold pyridoxal phosphate-dependent enzyme [Gammaproteobacteria bacterium]
MREQLFHLSPESGTSLQSQLREMMVRAILGGHILPGSAVPSCRQLAKQLGVARNTVVLAYQHLVDEGYLVARERSGYYVNQDILAGRVSADAAEPRSGDMFAPEWSERLRTTPSHWRQIVKPKDWLEYPYPFIYGQCDLALFPVADWRECSRRALSVGAIRGWARDSVDSDDPELLEQIHTRLLPRRGVWASPDEILITVGAQHALYLLASLLFGDDTAVGIEDPGYVDARTIFRMTAARVIGLPVDESGLAADEKLDACDYVYVTPSHQSPTTVTMPLERRHQLLARSVDSDFVIIEDDYESEFNFMGQPTPALKSLDHSNRVVYVGSLSKTLAPGLRLGYMVGPKELIDEARALRRLMLRHPPANNERAVALFLSLGHHDSLVRRLSHAYKERWQVMGEALARHLPESARMPAFGGTSYWVKGPADLDARVLSERAADRGILIEPGDVFFFSDDPPRNFFRMGFSSIPVDRIEPGIEILAGIVHDLA